MIASNNPKRATRPVGEPDMEAGVAGTASLE
jgi:hypothetical protein